MNHPTTPFRAVLLLTLLVCSFHVFGQIKVTGKVSDKSTGEPIPGASIIVKGTTTGTATNTEGAYELSVPQGNAVLIFSFVGFATEEVALNSRTTLDVALSVDYKQLSEVVVTALGIKQQTKRLGYAVQELKGSDLDKAREPNFVSGLAVK